jgi:SEC-C motif-containing protein
MRSRYSAYAVGDTAYVFRTWHPRTRPEHVLGTPETTWTGLEILDVVDGGPDDATGIVEFRASYTDASGPGVVHERSTFVRRAGRWVYVSPT